jgi:hypothetical protein
MIQSHKPLDVSDDCSHITRPIDALQLLGLTPEPVSVVDFTDRDVDYDNRKTKPRCIRYSRRSMNNIS